MEYIQHYQQTHNHIDSKKIKTKKGRKARFLIEKTINIIVQDRH